MDGEEQQQGKGQKSQHHRVMCMFLASNSWHENGEKENKIYKHSVQEQYQSWQLIAY